MRRFGFGWIFWPYKNLELRSFGGHDPKAGRLGFDCERRQCSRCAPCRRAQQAQAILDAYLEAAKFKNVRVNDAYIHSLGLKAP